MRSRIPEGLTRAACRLLLLATAASLAACSSEGNSDWLALYRVARDSWENRDAPVSLQQAATIPYATLGVRLNDGREQILILATDDHGLRLWTSSARVAISTHDGRIVRTAGLGADLAGYVSDGHGPENWSSPHHYTWQADFTDLGLYSTRVECEVTPAGADPIEILGNRFDTIRVDETCRDEQLGWSFTNSYWISASTQTVWRSIQQTHPKGPKLEIEILRPPSTE